MVWENPNISPFPHLPTDQGSEDLCGLQAFKFSQTIFQKNPEKSLIFAIFRGQNSEIYRELFSWSPHKIHEKPYGTTYYSRCTKFNQIAYTPFLLRIYHFTLHLRILVSY